MARLPKMPDFPEWLRSDAVRHEAKKLWSQLPRRRDPAKARGVLEQLITNPLMKVVWDQLFRKSLVHPEGFFHPARLTNASNAVALREEALILRKKGGEQNRGDADLLEFEARFIEVRPDEPADPRWDEQHRAAQLFLSGAYRAALNTEPQLVSDIQTEKRKLQSAAKTLRRLAKENEIYAEELRNIASNFDEKSIKSINDPWLVTRKRGDLRRKTFVGKLSYATHLLFKTPVHSAIANVTNVVFCTIGLASKQHGATPITGETVREMLRLNPPRIRPTFGRSVMPLIETRMRELEQKLWGSRS